MPSSSDPRVAELVYRDGPSPHKYPELEVFTLRCRRVIFYPSMVVCNIEKLIVRTEIKVIREKFTCELRK